MNNKPRTNEKQSERNFVDALREVLGKPPLYSTDIEPSPVTVYSHPLYNPRTPAR